MSLFPGFFPRSQVVDAIVLSSGDIGMVSWYDGVVYFHATKTGWESYIPTEVLGATEGGGLTMARIK